VKIYFSIVAFQKTPVSLENLNHFFGASPLDTSHAFWEFFTDGISEKIKKGTI
jgi:hypothetical protein